MALGTEGKYPHKKHKQEYDSDNFSAEILKNEDKVDLSTNLSTINIVGNLTVNDIPFNPDSQNANAINFNTSFTGGTSIPGQVRWNDHDKTMEWVTPFSVTQGNQEIGLPVKNNTGGTLLNGRLVRITGYNGSYYEIGYSDNRTEEASHVDGMLTADVLDGEVTIFVKIGIVRGLDTSLYNENDDVFLGNNGSWSTTEPTVPNFVRLVGHVGKIDATEGELYIDCTGLGLGDIEQAITDSGMPHGIPASQKSLIEFEYNSATRTFHIKNPHYYYFKGNKVIIPYGSQTINHADTTGTYYLCYTETGLVFDTTPFVFGECVPLAIVIYNNSTATTFWTGADGKILDERHGCVMDKATHKELHETVGCYATTGFAAAGYTQATGTGGLTANTYSVDTGTVNDEDLATLLPSLPDNNGIGDNYTIYYKSGNEWRWFKTNLPYLFTATNILYNQITAGSGSLVQITNNGYYMNTYVVGMPNLSKATGLPTNEGIAIILGQNQYTSLALAQSESITGLDLAGFPGPEVAPLYQITWQRQSSYDDNGNCRIESFRKIVGIKLSLATGGVSPSIHNNLAGRSDADAHPISSITDLQTTLDGKVVGPASSVDNSIPIYDGLTGKILKDNSKVSIVDGNIVGSNSSFIIGTNSTDGLDNKRLQLSATANGVIGNNRGGYINIHGNEYTGALGGSIALIGGNVASGYITFFTGAAERMRIEKDGNIGIGTGAIGTALGKVDISNGSIGLVVGADEGVDTRTNSTTKLTRIGMPHYTNAEEPIALIRASAEVADNRVMIGGGTGTMNAATQISFYTAANNTTVTGTERMKIDYFGRVGIGTAAIGATLGKLDISSGSIALVLGADSNAETRTDNTIKYTRIGSANYVNTEEPFSLIGGISNVSNNEVSIGGGTSLLNSATILRFYTGSYNTTTGTQRMLINSVGNVGIGTDTPGAKLDISNGGIGLIVGADNTLDTRTNLSTKYGRIATPHYTNAEEPIGLIIGSAEEIQNRVWIGGGTSVLNAATVIQFFTATNNTTVTGTEAMRIVSDGKVGINTTSPSEKLHVAGNIAVTGTVDGRDVSADGAKLDGLSSQIAAGITYANVANTVDMLTLNDEKTLFTVPTGKQAMIGDSIPYMNAFFSEYAGTATGSGVVTISYYNTTGSPQTATISNITGNTFYLNSSIIPPVIGPGAVKAKVTTVMTGVTTAKLHIKLSVTY